MTASPVLDRLAIWRSSRVSLGLLGLVGGCVLGAISAYAPRLSAVGLGAVLLLAAVAHRPVYLAVIALVGVFVVQRVGSASFAPGSAGGVSYSDALLALAAFFALPALIGTPELDRLRLALLGLGVYLSCLLPTVFLNPSTRAYLEWTHRLVLVGGALLVGAWIAREGITRLALHWLTGVSCLVAVLAIENSARHGFAPASPLELNKNFLGALFSAVVIVLVVAPQQIGLRPSMRLAAVVLAAGGLLASQSRGGMLAAALGLLLAFALDPRAHSRGAKALAILVTIVFAIFVFVSVRSQLHETTADLNNNSLGVRFNVERVTRDIWRTSPVVGVGLKYFYTGDYGQFANAATNDVDNELAESGVIGLVGFVVFQGAVLYAGMRRRRGHPLVIAGIGVVAGELLHGMVDVYWQAGVISLPFLILGMGLVGAPHSMAQPAPIARHPLRGPR